jgi:hypothetical protein
MWIARHFPAAPGRGAIPVTTEQSPAASTGQSPAMSRSHHIGAAPAFDLISRPHQRPWAAVS